MKFKPKATPPLTLDKDPDYISPQGNSELVTLLKDLQLRFVPNSDFHNKLSKAIQLAQQ